MNDTFDKNYKMVFPAPLTIDWIASFINATIINNTGKAITGINEIHNVHEGDLVFVDHPKYYQTCLNSNATFIIINKELAAPEGKTLLVVSDPFEAYLKIVDHFRPFTPANKMISDTSTIGASSVIMPNVFIGNHVVIGENCIIHPNVTVYDHCIIGNNVVIHAGAVIGCDAFYFNTKKNRSLWYKKMLSGGRVVIEDNVEIGANCTIDRGVSADTRLGTGTKLDNLVHLGHEVVTGNNCLIAAQVGIAGCTTLGNGVTLWGQVGVNKTLHIGDNAVVLAQSGVPGDLAPGGIFMGSPSKEAGTHKREMVWAKRIPEMWDRLMKLSEK